MQYHVQRGRHKIASKLFVLVVLLLAMGSCSNGLNVETRIGYIQFLDLPVSIHIPESVLVGEPVEIDLTTYGSGCLRKGRVSVNKVKEDQIEFIPYDRYIDDSEFACTEQVEINIYSIALEFDKPGSKTLIIKGRVYGLGGVQEDTIQVERHIDVLTE